MSAAIFLSTWDAAKPSITTRRRASTPPPPTPAPTAPPNLNFHPAFVSLDGEANQSRGKYWRGPRVAFPARPDNFPTRSRFQLSGSIGKGGLPPGNRRLGGGNSYAEIHLLQRISCLSRFLGPYLLFNPSSGSTWRRGWPRGWRRRFPRRWRLWRRRISWWRIFRRWLPWRLVRRLSRWRIRRGTRLLRRLPRRIWLLLGAGVLRRNARLRPLLTFLGHRGARWA